MTADASPSLQPDRVRALQAGIAPAYALLAGQQLGLFSALGAQSLSAQALAAGLGVPAGRLERLLYALVVAGLLEQEGGLFRNGPEAATFLVRGQPRYLGDDHELLAELWHADLQTAASIRSGRPAAAHDFSQVDAAASAAFLRGLAPSALRFGRELAARFDFSTSRSVLDVGGGPGTALVGLREANPALTLTLFELPRMLPLAEAILADFLPPGSVAFEGGDITQGPSAGRHDVLLLKAVIQVLPPDEAALALRHAGASLRPGGRVFITGVGILNDDRVSPAEAVYFNLTFQNLYAGGASHTLSQHADWLRAAGFGEMACSTLDSGSQLIVAAKL